MTQLTKTEHAPKYADKPCNLKS